jgi:serine/threonine protein kinase
VHRDLKLENVLFESKARSRIKVVDFGIAGRCTPSVTDKTDAGTLRYMAPEVLNGSDTKAKPAIDIWAIGCMLYCMLFYKFPFNGESGHQVKDKIINQELRFPSDQALTEECSDMIRGLLTKDPAQRYTLAAIKQHKWLLLSDSAIQMKVDIA